MFGKWLGGGLGFVLGGPIGGLLGFLAGTALDETADQYTGSSNSAEVTARGDFGMSLLVLIAAVMKADGKVVKSELDYVKKFFLAQFGQESSKQALLVLKDLLKKDIMVRDICIQIKQNMDYSSRLQLIHLLFNLSQADSNINNAELELLGKISGAMGITQNDYASIKNMFVPETDSYYKILEVEKTVSDEELKKAFRKMAMKYHPDKVTHLGDEFKKTAEEKFRMVNEAYDRIKKERNIA
ncbi:MAG TPA: TerB family tellurite resistance protein [Bacteroidales bacterium]|nr:TerB family tellurite resistance protein [Bacteroidales bacterium]